ncbi:MAG: TM2 domain-containing membrane protein YozV [Flavobacteriales bacterium]|jgi:TM2 domain-containing membrane protein YozV
MKFSILILTFCFLTYSQVGFSQRMDAPQYKTESTKHRNVVLSKKRTEKHSKAVAAALNISLGLFGVHRLYLGTSPQVPVIYTLTLGGGGVLMLSDLGVILFTKDLEQFANDPSVIMWNK